MWALDLKGNSVNTIMPHVVLEKKNYTNFQGNLSISLKTPVKNDYCQYLLRNSSTNHTWTPKKHVEPVSNNFLYKNETIDKESFMRRVGLVAKTSDNSCHLLTDSKLTRSPLRSQICRGLKNNVTMKNMVEVDFSSNVGQTLARFTNFMKPLDNEALAAVGANKYERFCSDSVEPETCKIQTLRTRAITNYPVTYQFMKRGKPTTVWGHMYCFNKKQRQEQKIAFKTGLNKRARSLKRLCKPCSVQLELLKLNSDSRINLNVNLKQPKILIEPLPDEGNKSVKSLSFESNVKNDKVSTDKPLIGKEIIIDGTVVIDLCSDDENDSVVVFQKSSPKKLLRNGYTPDDVHLRNNVRRNSATVSTNSNSNFYSYNNRVPLASLPKKGMECKVKVNDITKSFTLASNGQTYVANTQVRVANKCDDNNVCQDRKTMNVSSANNLCYKLKKKSQNQSILDYFKPIQVTNKKENDCRQVQTNETSRKRKRDMTELSLPKSIYNNSARKTLRPIATRQVNNIHTSQNSENLLRNNDVKISTSRCTATSFQTVVKFNCRICGSSGLIPHRFCKQNIDQHMNRYHGGYAGSMLIKQTSKKTGYIIIEALPDTESNSK